MKLISIVGARPQFIKAAVIHRELKNHKNIEEVIIHSGQHYDKNMSAIFFDELDISPPKYNLGVGSGSHAIQTAKMMMGFEDVFLKEKPDICLVYGDTNSTIAAALTASKLHIPIAHIEAGLRSFNKNMPEEINRILTDHISEWLFTPTETANNLLKNEGLAKKSHLVGDVMYDSILFYKEMIENERSNVSNIIPKKPYYLATIHRAENTDSKDRLTEIVNAFNKIDKQIVLPLHPRTVQYIKDYGLSFSEHINIIEPISYKQMVSLLISTELILTDSGGLQKEAYFLKKPCITLRDETEWVETLKTGWNTIVGANEEKILNAISNLNPQEHHNYYGDGNSGKKIISILNGC